MRTLSLRDVMLHEKLKGKNEIKIIHPSNDNLMREVLYDCGFDVKQGIAYIPSLHRDMQNKIAVGFQVVGELRKDREFINSGMCDVYELISIASETDVSLAKELCSLQDGRINYEAVDKNAKQDDDFPVCLVEPTEDFHARQIAQLENIRQLLRGDAYDGAGSYRKLGV